MYSYYNNNFYTVYIYVRNIYVHMYKMRKLSTTSSALLCDNTQMLLVGEGVTLPSIKVQYLCI